MKEDVKGTIKRRFDGYMALHGITERVKELVIRKEYDELPVLLERRQKILDKIQSFDTSEANSPAKNREKDEISRILDKVKEMDREIRLRLTCERDALSKEMMDIRQSRRALRGYKKALSLDRSYRIGRKIL